MYLSKKLSLKVLALFLALSMVFSACSKKKTPSVMLDEATEKQEQNYNKTRAQLPDFERFNNKPIEQSGKFTFLDSSDSSMSFLKNASVAFNGKIDNLSKKLLIDLGFTSDGVTIDGNQFYMSEDTLALSIPLLYNAQKYITMNTATFVEDWNKSPLGMGSSQIPTAVNVPELVAAAFDTKYDKEFSTNLLNSYNEQLKLFNEKRVFGETTKEALKLTGTEETYNIVTYTIPAAALQEFYLNTVNLYMDNITSYYTSNQPLMDFYKATGTDMNDVFESMNDSKEMLSKLTFTSDATVKTYINKKDLIHRVDVENLSVKNTFDDGAEAEEYVINMIHNFTGEKHVYDSSKTTVNVTDKALDTTEKIIITRLSPADKNKFTENWTLEFLSSDDTPDITMNFLMSWDLALKEGNNFEISFSVPNISNASPLNFSLIGNLMSSEKSLEFTNGIFEANVEGDMIKLGVDYKMQNIIGTEISIDLDNSKKLTDFTQEELSALFQANF